MKDRSPKSKQTFSHLLLIAGHADRLGFVTVTDIYLRRLSLHPVIMETTWIANSIDTFIKNIQHQYIYIYFTESVPALVNMMWMVYIMIIYKHNVYL